MRLVLLLCFVLAGASRAHVVTCDDNDQVSRDQRIAATDAETRFEDELAKVRLAPVVLRRVTWEAEPGESSMNGGTVIREIDGQPMTVVVVDSRGLACGHEALMTKAQQLVLVKRTPYAATTRHVLACREQHRPPDRCAAVAASHRVGYVVPAWFRYVGTRDVSYPVDVLDVRSLQNDFSEQASESLPESALFPRP